MGVPARPPPPQLIAFQRQQSAVPARACCLQSARAGVDVQTNVIAHAGGTLGPPAGPEMRERCGVQEATGDRDAFIRSLRPATPDWVQGKRAVGQGWVNDAGQSTHVPLRNGDPGTVLYAYATSSLWLVLLGAAPDDDDDDDAMHLARRWASRLLALTTRLLCYPQLDHGLWAADAVCSPAGRACWCGRGAG